MDENKKRAYRPHPLLADSERQPCEIWTRVMGYHRPVASFNIGKQGEFHERRNFVVSPPRPVRALADA